MFKFTNIQIQSIFVVVLNKGATRTFYRRPSSVSPQSRFPGHLAESTEEGCIGKYPYSDLNSKPPPPGLRHHYSIKLRKTPLLYKSNYQIIQLFANSGGVFSSTGVFVIDRINSTISFSQINSNVPNE